MAHSRAGNLRYMAAKLQLAVQEASAALGSATASLPDAVARGLEAWRLPLTSVMLITGAAMSPTLNPKGARCVR